MCMRGSNEDTPVVGHRRPRVDDESPMSVLTVAQTVLRAEALDREDSRATHGAGGEDVAPAEEPGPPTSVAASRRRSASPACGDGPRGRERQRRKEISSVQVTSADADVEGSVAENRVRSGSGSQLHWF